ncbi:MAG: fumarate hydratase [Lachnospiraceae bacterium]|nr:fumarate hydratase [Lachnospiraceae bacterium]
MNIVQAVEDALVRAGSTFSEDKIEAYQRAINSETNERAKWVLQTILDNAEAAQRDRSPLCDDTGIPHLVLDMGKNQSLSTKELDDIYIGVEEGLRKLPGRPMALLGDDEQRIDQSAGISELSEMVLPAPLQIRRIEEEVRRLHVLMLGGGPAIRAKTYRVFHKHSVQAVEDEIVSWSVESTAQLGCSPCTLAIGIGRSHYEAASLMIQAMVDGNYRCQSELENRITDRVNQMHTGPLGLGGDHTVLGTFLKVGPQRASGVRIVSIRPCCCFEPRIATIELTL